MQKNWFKKINNKNNYYFLIIHEEEPVGLTNIKDIDFKSGTGESGIFLHSPVYTGSIVAIQAIFTTLDFAFIDLNLISLYQTILISNKAAIKLNKYLGVQIVESKDGVIRSILKKENYLIKTHKNRIFLKKHYEN